MDNFINYHHRDCLIFEDQSCDCGIQELLDDGAVEKVVVDSPVGITTAIILHPKGEKNS